MARTVEVTVPADRATEVVERLRATDGVLGVAHRRGTSVQPPGDEVVVRTTTDGAPRVFAALRELGLLDAEERSIATAEPDSLLSSRGSTSRLDREPNESLWEEMGSLLRRQSNLQPNFLALMALSGGVAAVGLWTDTLHVVVAAMVIAPGFEPILRVAFGAVVGPAGHVRQGGVGTLVGYGALAVGGAATALVLAVLDPAAGARLETHHWVRYWSSITPSSVLVSVLAATAGAVVVATRRSVLTAGVMIALALIPSATLVGVAAARGDGGLAAGAAARWLVDVAAVAVMSAVVYLAKGGRMHRGRSAG